MWTKSEKRRFIVISKDSENKYVTVESVDELVCQLKDLGFNFPKEEDELRDWAEKAQIGFKMWLVNFSIRRTYYLK